jgi:hypothetical protein
MCLIRFFSSKILSFRIGIVTKVNLFNFWLEVLPCLEDFLSRGRVRGLLVLGIFLLYTPLIFDMGMYAWYYCLFK